MGLGASLIGAGTSLVGNLFGFGSNKSANKTNKEIAQMNNDFNAAEAQKSRDFQQSMFDQSNEWNSAASQRKRYEEAGLNPFNMASGGNAGVASSGSSGAQATSSGNPTMQAFKPDMTSLGSTITSIAQAKNLNANTQKTEIQNLQESDRIAAEIRQTIGNTDYSKQSPEAQKYYRNMGLKAAQIQMSSLDQQLANAKYAGSLTQAQTANTLLSGEAQSVLNRYIDQSSRLELDLKAANITNAVMEGQLKPVQAQKIIADTILSYAKSKGQRIDNSIASRTAQSLIDANNAANNYNSSYYGQGSKGAKSMFNMDYNAKKYNTEMLKYGAGTSKRDYATYGLRNAIDYSGKVLQSVGNSIGTGINYKRMKHDTGPHGEYKSGRKNSDGSYWESRDRW